MITLFYLLINILALTNMHDSSSIVISTFTSCHLFIKCLWINIYFSLYSPYFQIVKKPGVTIKPIEYEEVDPHEKLDEPKRVIHRATPNPNVKKSSAKQAKVARSHEKMKSPVLEQYDLQLLHVVRSDDKLKIAQLEFVTHAASSKQHTRKCIGVSSHCENEIHLQYDPRKGLKFEARRFHTIGLIRSCILLPSR
jgi:hypothetical protein